MCKGTAYAKKPIKKPHINVIVTTSLVKLLTIQTWRGCNGSKRELGNYRLKRKAEKVIRYKAPWILNNAH